MGRVVEDGVCVLDEVDVAWVFIAELQLVGVRGWLDEEAAFGVEEDGEVCEEGVLGLC